jgi:hypothetical protein
VLTASQNEYTGLLFDLYAHPEWRHLWLVGDDEKRYCFRDDFETTFYVSGPFPRFEECMALPA